MAFENVGSILRIGSLFSSFKLLLITASFSRPKYRALCLQLLRPFVRNGEVSLRYRCYGRSMRCFIRLSDMGSDLRSVLELCVADTYELDRGFKPDLVIDGGGNIGLFTLRSSAAFASSVDSPVRFVICEPMPQNIDQIRKHLSINKISGEIMAGCLGGDRRSIPFYYREAISSSFDPTKPYTSVVEMPVETLESVIGTYPATRILIKLDIEGMEIETLRSFVPSERRPVYVVGELHNYAENSSIMEQIFLDQGWAFEYTFVADDNANFRACSPAALPMLASMAGIRSSVRV
jgi:FkbM family methyltransferase